MGVARFGPVAEAVLHAGLNPGAGRRVVRSLCLVIVVLASGLVMIPKPVAASVPVPTVNAGDGISVYGVTGNSTPQVRGYTASTNVYGSAAATVAGAPGRRVVTRTSPVKQEAVVGYMSATNVLQIMCFNGTSWTNEWTATMPTALQAFDIAYERATGNVVVLYSTGSANTNELAYRTKAASTTCGSANWSGATNLDPAQTTQPVQWVKLTADTRASSSLITAAWTDLPGGPLHRLSAMQWSGTAWGNEPAAALETALDFVTATGDMSPFDLQYESLSGDLMVVWGNQLGSDGVNGIRYATCTGGTASCTWSSAQTPPTFVDDGSTLDISANPGTDEIVFASIGDAGGVDSGDLQVGYWSGTAWTNTANVDTATNQPQPSFQTVATGWLRSGAVNRSVIYYKDVDNNLSWVVGNGSTFTVQSDFTATPSLAAVQNASITVDPFNPNRLMLSAVNSGFDYFAKRLVMNNSGAFTWTNADGGSALETDVTTANADSASFAYWRYTAASTEVSIDATMSTNNSRSHDGSSPTTVFVSDQTGYTFYSNASDVCAYSKTTDGGTTWGAAVSVVTGNCLHMSIWYDRWTPGDTTGNYIHILLDDYGFQDLKYNRLDTTSDTLLSGTAPVRISSAPGPAKTNSISASDNYNSISKATNGHIYAGVHDSGSGGEQSYVLKCTTACDTASNWSDTSITLVNDANNALQLLPLASSDMLAITADDASDDVASKVYHLGTGSWDGSWTTIDANASWSGAYAGSSISATVDLQNNDIYLAYVGDAQAGLNDDDIRTARYSSGSWTTKTNVVNNDTRAIINAHIALDQYSGTVYVGYSARTDVGSPVTTNIYWKKSTDSMTTWGSEQGKVNAVAMTTGDVAGFRLNVMSDERIYATYVLENSKLYGNTIADLATPSVMTQSQFRWYENADSLTPGLPIAAQNTAANVANTSTVARLRTNIGVANSQLSAGTQAFKLQYGTSTAGPWTDVGGSATWMFHDNATAANSATLPSTLLGSSNVNCSYVESNPTPSNPNTVAVGNFCEWDFALIPSPGVVLGTDYFFRMVKANGAALGAYSTYPTISVGIGNAAPGVPTALAQTNTTATPLATGSWTNETSVRFTATATDADNPDTVALCVEVQAITVAFTNTENSCGTGVAYSGSGVAVAHTVSSLAPNTRYHWQARIRDAGGLYSSWVPYGANTDPNDADFGVDTTAPTGGVVYDGSSIGVDTGYNNGSLDSLSANWSGFDATASGLARYDYAIGTTAGGTQVRDWTANGTAAAVDATGLTLRTNVTYYFSVRAVDNAGNMQSGVNSNGQMVAPTLSFTVDRSGVDLVNISNITAFTDLEGVNLTTSTNAYSGYVIRSSATGPARWAGSRTIPAFSGGTYVAPDAWQSGDMGLGYTSSDTSIQGQNKFQSGVCAGGNLNQAPGCYAPFSNTLPGDIVADHTDTSSGTPIVDETFLLTWRATVDARQPAGEYRTNIMFSCTALY